VTVGLIASTLPLLLAVLTLWQGTRRPALRAPLLLAALAFVLEAFAVVLLGVTLERGLDTARSLPPEVPGGYTSRFQVEDTNVVTPLLLAWCGAVLAGGSTAWLAWRRSPLALLTALGLLAVIVT